MEGRALGKGLSALIPEKKSDNKAGSVTYLKTARIMDNALQPRTVYDEEKLEELMASIKEKGVLQPILVREKGDHYEVVAGERRLKASRALGLEEIPAVVKNVTDQEAFIIALVENIQREELNPIEEAEAYRRMIEDFNYSQETVASSVGKDRSTISNMMRLLRLPGAIQKGISAGQVSVGHARALLSLELPTERERVYNLILEKGLSVREVENLVQSKATGGKRRIKSKGDRSHELVTLEEELQRILGTKVRVVSQKKRGKVVIEYYSLDDLDRIIQLIKK